ncbi:hypothetical protein RCH07_001751, partial [Arthrobacter sp. CG_A4]|nr:hypothetical protein [Arthrobacter sp. CG_A4]
MVELAGPAALCGGSGFYSWFQILQLSSPVFPGVLVV